MKPRNVDVHLYRIPSRHVQQNATHTFTEYEYIIVNVNFDNGIVGTGWTYTQGRGGTSVLSLISDYLSKQLIQDGVSSITDLYRRMWDYAYSYGLEGISRLAFAALDIAFHDALSKEAEEPLWIYLGGKEDAKIRTYRSAIDLNMTNEELRRDIASFVREGYSAFKIKVGREDFSEDLERIDIVRGLIGEEALLMVDANRKWTLKEALTKGVALQEKGIFWLEEPVESDMFDDYLFLRNRLTLRIAGGESLYNRFQFRQFLLMHCADISQIDVIRAGGIHEWMKLAVLADSMGIQVSPHFSEEISLHALLAVPNALFLEHLPGSNLRDAGIIRNPFKIERGFAIPNRTPGHGVEFDTKALEKYMVK